MQGIHTPLGSAFNPAVYLYCLLRTENKESFSLSGKYQIMDAKNCPHGTDLFPESECANAGLYLSSSGIRTINNMRHPGYLPETPSLEDPRLQQLWDPTTPCRSCACAVSRGAGDSVYWTSFNPFHKHNFQAACCIR